MPAIAGPGAGKTRSIQLRAVNLLLMGQAATGELALCTFGRDAASELQRRFVLHQEFDAIFGPGWDIVSKCGWRDGVHTAAEAARYFDRICDELIDPTAPAGPDRPFIAALGRCCMRHRDLLQEEGMVDFAHMQVWAERVLRDDEEWKRDGESRPRASGGTPAGPAPGVRTPDRDHRRKARRTTTGCNGTRGFRYPGAERAAHENNCTGLRLN